MIWPYALALALLLAFVFRRALLRGVALALVHTVYSIRVRGLEHLPEAGALLVANHLSFADALFVGAAIPRPVSFLMQSSSFKTPLIGSFARLMYAIPIASEDTAEAKAVSLRLAAERARSGALVCIFPEGGIARHGTLLPFKRGMERIAREAGVPIVPIALDRVWGSIFSFSGGRAFWKVPERLPYPIDVGIAAPLACDTEAWRARDALAAELASMREERARHSRTLGYRFLRSAMKHAGRTALVDTNGARWTYRELARRALVLARLLESECAGEERVGVLLPPSAAGALVNVALALANKASVNLNYTLSAADLAFGIERAGLKTVISSRRVLDLLGDAHLPPSVRVCELESLPARIGKASKLRALALSFLPGFLLARLCAPGWESTRSATVIFTSGSSGEPKGVLLSHGNIAANVVSFSQAIALGPDDRVLGVLPFFHSFGYTVSLWAPLFSGACCVFHNNPLDAKTIRELVRSERATILIGAPTFLRAWGKRFEPADVASVRLVVSGAERMPEDLRTQWKERLGIELYEGYGATELSPAAAVNLPDFVQGSTRQIGHKPGSVGRALPGVALRIVDPDTFELRAPGEEGLLLVRGANVMQGYLGDPERTRAALRDGWYVTGDIALIDAEAFLVITDRLARFSKIGGEMVPHGRVEEALRRALERTGDGALELAVCSLADSTRGERLVVLHTTKVAPELWLAELASEGLPNLFVPRAQAFVRVASLPRLASGKLDWRAARALAAAALEPA